MSYEKLTLAKFIENLGEDKYGNLTGARRAIGKADWSDKDKSKAKEAAEKHFGDSVNETAKVLKAKKVAKPAKAEAVPGVKRKPGRPPGSGASKAGKPVASAKKASAAPSEDATLAQRLSMHAEVIATTAHAVTAVSEAARLANCVIDTSELSVAVDLLTATLRSYEELVTQSGMMGRKASPPAVASEPDEEVEAEEPRQAELFANN